MQLNGTEGLFVRVVAVVVAYNRRELLIECLEALHAQTRPLDQIIVVDNASEDGSADSVATLFPQAHLLRVSVNSGGAGGFAIGLECAISDEQADLVWVMDDDTIPTPTSLAAMLEARAAARETPAILCSRVVWVDGVDHPMNTPRRKPLGSRAEARDAKAAGGVPVRSASFVSMLVDADAVRQEGFPVAEYFIWNDDFEFTSRILRTRRGLFIPASVVVHKTKARADTDADPGDRFYYEVRNKLWVFRASAALFWFEKPLYIAATARRWARTLARSRDRATIVQGFKLGWRDGMRSKPRPNSDYLRSLGIEHSSRIAGEQSRP